MQTDSERALQVLERYLDDGESPRLRERAFFVLSQSSSPKARELLVAAARGERGREAQLDALRYVGFMDELDTAVLDGIYRQTTDPEVKRHLLEAFGMRGDKARLMQAFRDEKDPEARRRAVQYLGMAEANDELRQLYKSETSPEVKGMILDALSVADDPGLLIDVAKNEKDETLRRRAVQALAMCDSEEARTFLDELYRTTDDVETKVAVLQSFAFGSNVDRLIEIAKTEKDPALRRAAVQWLGMSGSEEAVKFLVELLEKE